jgi:hypothetical protein
VITLHPQGSYAVAINHFRRVFPYLGEGRHRVVFAARDGSAVIKVPRDEDGRLPIGASCVVITGLGTPSVTRERGTTVDTPNDSVFISFGWNG